MRPPLPRRRRHAALQIRDNSCHPAARRASVGALHPSLPMRHREAQTVMVLQHSGVIDGRDPSARDSAQQQALDRSSPRPTRSCGGSPQVCAGMTSTRP